MVHAISSWPRNRWRWPRFHFDRYPISSDTIQSSVCWGRFLKSIGIACLLEYPFRSSQQFFQRVNSNVCGLLCLKLKEWNVEKDCKTTHSHNTKKEVESFHEWHYLRALEYCLSGMKEKSTNELCLQWSERGECSTCPVGSILCGGRGLAFIFARSCSVVIFDWCLCRNFLI